MNSTALRRFADRRFHWQVFDNLLWIGFPLCAWQLHDVWHQFRHNSMGTALASAILSAIAPVLIGVIVIAGLEHATFYIARRLARGPTTAELVYEGGETVWAFGGAEERRVASLEGRADVA